MGAAHEARERREETRNVQMETGRIREKELGAAGTREWSAATSKIQH